MRTKEENSHRFSINTESDVAISTYTTLSFSKKLGFNTVKQLMIATAVSELATNIIKYAKSGHITVAKVTQMNDQGIEVIAEDHGPGIANRELALQDNFSTSKSLGIGLPGVRRLMDEFLMDSAEGMGTKIVARKWKST